MDKYPWLAAEGGVIGAEDTVTLSGANVSFSPYPSRTFAAAAADVLTDFADGDAVTVLLSENPTNWQLYEHAVWNAVDGETPAYLDLSGAVLASEAGTLSVGDIIAVIAVTPVPSVRRAVPTTPTDSGYAGDWAFDETTGYRYYWVDTDVVVRSVTEYTW